MARPHLWEDRGACIGLDPEYFAAEDRADEARALAVCARCPVVDACLEAELAVVEDLLEVRGVRAGMPARERRRLLRARRAT